MRSLSRHVCSGIRGARTLQVASHHHHVANCRQRITSARFGTSSAASTTQAGPEALFRQTEVEDRVSPPEVIAAKAQQLAALGPAGWKQQLVQKLVSVPVWLGAAGGLLVKYASRPSALTSQPDPSVFQPTPPFAIEEGFITVNGIRLHTVSPKRRPDKPLMLFLHGFPECWYSWRHQLPEFSSDFDAVAIDMRGYGTSDKPQGVDSYRLELLASDIQQAVAALGHSSCTLVAHDWGGSVAWLVAGLYGCSLVDQLIVLGLPHVGIWKTNVTPAQEKRSLYMLLFQAPVLPEAMLTAGNAEFMEGMLTSEESGCCNKGVISPADVEWFRWAMCQPGAATAMLNYYRALVPFFNNSEPQHPVWGALKRQLDMPVLVLHGDKDVALGVELLDGIEAAVPQVTVKLLRNCSHWVAQDYPYQVNQLLRDWLKQQQQQQQQQQ